jgi:hypothetical protein
MTDVDPAAPESAKDAGVETPRTPSDSAWRPPGEAAAAPDELDIPISVQRKVVDAKAFAVHGAQLLTAQARGRPVLPVALIIGVAVGFVVWRRRR